MRLRIYTNHNRTLVFSGTEDEAVGRVRLRLSENRLILDGKTWTIVNRVILPGDVGFWVS